MRREGRNVNNQSMTPIMEGIMVSGCLQNILCRIWPHVITVIGDLGASAAVWLPVLF